MSQFVVKLCNASSPTGVASMSNSLAVDLGFRPSVECSNQQFRLMAKEFSEAVSGLNEAELENALKCLGLGRLGLRKNDPENAQYPANMIWQYAHGLYLDRKIKLLELR